MLRGFGITLLTLGFVALATLAWIYDPTALDANIGAGFLKIVGIPLGLLGLLLLLIDGVRSIVSRHA